MEKLVVAMAQEPVASGVVQGWDSDNSQKLPKCPPPL